jgi:hypothetical protein
LALVTFSRRVAVAALPLVLILTGLQTPAQAKVFHSQQEALALAFPDADEIRVKTAVLTKQQASRVEELAGAELDTEIVKLYSGWKAGELLGYAYIDVHRVRTLSEAFMVVLTPGGAVRSLRVLAFYEPLDYLPTDRWYRQFDGVPPQSQPLRVGRDIHGIMGATLSARAVAGSVRRVQAFYEVLIRVPEDLALRN